MTSTTPASTELSTRVREALEACGVEAASLSGEHSARTPITGETLATIPVTSGDEIDAMITRAHQAFLGWREVPAPVRGQLVKRWGELLTEHKTELATIVQAEAGKIMSEALGEVQEMIDICDLAVGQSRQLYGKTMPSERAGHRLMENWHPLGVVGIITAFNFPAAVFSWNTALALVAGDTVIWKPSGLVTLTALATNALLARAVADVGAPSDLHHLIIADRHAGQRLVEDPRIALLSATGSVRMGREIAPRVAERFGRALLELGGNNAAIVAPSADLDLALRGIVFAAAGTAGQRCTTMRRLIVHESIVDELSRRLVESYKTLSIGTPLDDANLVGPLINKGGYEGMQHALETAQQQGGTILYGGKRVDEQQNPDAYYVEPTLVRMPEQSSIVKDETFAPILYIMTYSTFDEAIALQNGVPQGLSSSIFTRDQAEAELFLSPSGSDCGIANVNLGTSGAEIGGAFGGEKETGGGRESGTDSWKTYMRQATSAVNYSGALPLAQGVKFV